jgi:hypothetical protein
MAPSSLASKESRARVTITISIRHQATDGGHALDHVYFDLLLGNEYKGLLHPCYAHMAASRSMQLFKLAYDPITRGQASRLARQPAPQYLSRIYMRSRWISFCTS